MSKYELPEWVIKYKEKGTTIKVRNGNYYLYKTQSIYDNKKKNNHYTKDTYMGRITEENGFIPSKKSNNVDAKSLFSKLYGPCLIFTRLGGDILTRLTQNFGTEYAKYIFTIASLRAIENTPYFELEDAFEDSYFSVLYKNLSMSKTTLSDFLKTLSRYKTNMNDFMKEDIEDDDILIFDGTNILCGSSSISYKGYGYLHGHNYTSQVNELYAYSVRNKKPIYYKLLEGSVADSTTLKDVLKESGIQNSISLIDKGFNSNSNLANLLKYKNKYIMALRSDSKLVPDEVLKDTMRAAAKEMFTINSEAVLAYETEITNEIIVSEDEKIIEDERICIYFNSTIAGIMDAEYIDKMNKNVKGYEKEKYAKAKERFGIYIIKTNVKDLTLEKIYQYYKSRFEIEYMFDTMKNTLGYDKSYMKSDESMESWAFINHISILLTQKVYDLLREKNIKLSLHQVYRKLRQIKMIRNSKSIDDNYELQGIPKKTRELLEKLEIVP